jgi:tyrosyl-tRNA synthetase
MDVVHILDELAARRLLADTTDLGALRHDLDRGSMPFYCGFDPTAPSLHLGNLIQLLTMRRLQLAGHRPLGLVGGATGLIGDPKEAGERRLNEADTVARWTLQLRGQIERFLDFDGPNGALVVNNADWTGPQSTIDFLRGTGKHFSVNRMLDREAVRARLAGSGISFTEFAYQLLQAQDYLHLFRTHGVRLQTGGSDQWGNLTAGVDLIRRATGEHVHAVCTQLLVKADGTKFGKTESGTVWLDAELTSPYAFSQFWINTDDRDVPTLLRTFSLRPVEEVEALIEQSAAEPHRRHGQRALARELTVVVHGEQAAAAAELAAEALFGRADLANLDATTLTAALRETPSVVLPSARMDGLTVADLFVAAGIVPSKGAARRAVADGGAYVNNERLGDADAVLPPDRLLPGGWVVLRRGRRTVGGVQFDGS